MINDILQRGDAESTLDYHKRLVYGKLVDKTLSDVDYTELAEALYGKSYSSDVARRMLYGSKRTLDVVEEEATNNITDRSVLSDIDVRALELQKERQKFYDQRREWNNLVKEFSREDNLYEVLKQSAMNIVDEYTDMYEEFEWSPVGKNEAVLVFGDWHYGMVTDNVYNKFNTEICKQRIVSVTEKAIDRIIANRCDVVNVVVLGDMFHGAIHNSARVASEELVCDQMMHATELLAETIIHISQYVCQVNVYMTYGNHARTVQNKNDSIHRDNMERVSRWWLEQRCQNYDKIIIHEDSKDEFICFECLGHGICAAHGDLDSVKNSPMVLNTLMQKTRGINVEYVILGDKHHSEQFNQLGVTSVICGSLCGTDDYANDKRLYSEPSQMLVIVNEKEGVDAEYKLRCD